MPDTDTRTPPLPLSQRALQAEAVEIKRQLDEMAREDADAPPEPPWLGDWVLFPTLEARIAEIERRHEQAARPRRRRLNFVR